MSLTKMLDKKREEDMKKPHEILASIVLSVFCLVCLYSDIAMADEFKHKLGIGALAGLNNTASSEMVGVDTSFDTVPVFGGSIVYFINKSYSIELSTQYMTTDLDIEFDDQSGTLGEIKQIPILLTARFQHPIQKSNTNLYLGVGAGYFINDFDPEQRNDLDDFFGVNVEADINNASYGWHANVGAEMFFKKRYSVYLDLKVIFTDAEFDLTYPDGTERTKDMALNASILVVGFNYYF